MKLGSESAEGLLRTRSLFCPIGYSINLLRMVYYIGDGMQEGS